MRCDSCNAEIDAAALRCAYCGAPTSDSAGQVVPDWHEQHLRRVRGRTASYADWDGPPGPELERMASGALIWSVVGAVTCCIPVAALVGVVLSLRVLGLAAERHLARPTRAVAAAIIGAVSLAVAASGWAWLIYELIIDEEHRAELRLHIGNAAHAPVLEPRVACRMLRLELLERDYADFGVRDELECAGRLEQRGNAGILHDVRIRTDDIDEIVFGCFERQSGRWAVTDIRKSAACPGLAVAVPSAYPLPPRSSQ